MQTLLKKYSTILLFSLLIIGGGFLGALDANAAVVTWKGTTNNNWNTASNWSGTGSVPGSGDIATFDNTCTSCNVTIDTNPNVLGIDMKATYTGTITQSSTYTITVGASGWVQAGGIFSGGSGAITTQTFMLSGTGDFKSTNGILTISYPGTTNTIFTISGASAIFRHNNGTVNFTASNDGNYFTYTVDVNSTLSLYDVVWNSTGGATPDVLTTAAGDTVIATNNFTYSRGALQGSWEVQGDVYIGANAGGWWGEDTGTLTMTGTARDTTYDCVAGGSGPRLYINTPGRTVRPTGTTTNLNVRRLNVFAGTFYAPSGTLTISDAVPEAGIIFAVSLGAVFEHSYGIVNFTAGNSGNYFTYTIDVNNTLSLYDVVWNSVDTATTDTLTTASGDTIIITHNLTDTNGSFGGTWQVQGNVSIASTADGGTATLSFTGGNSQTYQDLGGNEPDGDITINKTAGTVTLASNAEWNKTANGDANGTQDLTFSAGNLGTLSQGIYTISTGVWTHSGGTFAGGSGNITVSTTLGSGNMFALSGGTFTSTSGIFTLYNNYCGGNFNIFYKTGGTFSANSGTVYLNNADCWGEWGGATIVSNENLLFKNLTFQTTSSYSLNLQTITVSGDVTFVDGTVQDGTMDVSGNVYIQSGANGKTLGGPNDSGVVHMIGSDNAQIHNQAGGIGEHIKIEKTGSASVSPGATTTDFSFYQFSLVSGTFNAPSGTMSVGGWFSNNYTFFTKSGGTFNAGIGTVRAVPASGWGAGYNSTLNITSPITFNNFTLNEISTGIILSGGTNPVVSGTFTQERGFITGGTWDVQGNVVIQTTATGGTTQLNYTGGNNQTYQDLGGNEPDGDVTINKTAGTVTLASNAEWNATGQDLTFSAGNLGTLSQGIYTISTGIWTHGGGTFAGGSGNITIATPITSGNVFALSGGSFTSTTGTLLIHRTFVDHVTGTLKMIYKTGGTFSANNGTVHLYYETAWDPPVTTTVASNDTLSFKNLIFQMYSMSNRNALSLNSQTIAVSGDVTFINGVVESGTIDVSGNVYIQSGADGGKDLAPTVASAVVHMVGSGNAQIHNATGGTGERFTIEKTGGASVSPGATTTDFSLAGFSLVSGVFNAPSGTMLVGTQYGFDYTVLAKSGGTFNAGSGTVKIDTLSEWGSAGVSMYTITSPITFNNFTIAPSEGGSSLSGGINPVVSGTFTQERGYINSGTWDVQGNVVIQATATGGTTILNYTGGNNQTYSDTSVGGSDNEPNGDITINKTGGTVSTTTGFDWNATNQDVTVTAGALVVSGAGNANLNTLTVASGGEFVMNGSGNGTTTGILKIGTSVVNNGRISMRTNGTCGGLDNLLIRSSTAGSQKPWSGAGTFVMYDVSVQDMTSTVPITMLSSAKSNCNANWILSANSCPTRAITVPSGEIDVTSGTILVK